MKEMNSREKFEVRFFHCESFRVQKSNQQITGPYYRQLLHDCVNNTFALLRMRALSMNEGAIHGC